MCRFIRQSIPAQKNPTDRLPWHCDPLLISSDRFLLDHPILNLFHQMAPLLPHHLVESPHYDFYTKSNFRIYYAENLKNDRNWKKKLFDNNEKNAEQVFFTTAYALSLLRSDWFSIHRVKPFLDIFSHKSDKFSHLWFHAKVENLPKFLWSEMIL